MTKTNTLMNRILHILFSFILLFFIGLSNLSAQNNLSVAYSNFNTVPSFLNVCGEEDDVQLTISVNGGAIAARENIIADLQLFEGVELVSFDVEQSDAGVTLVNNSNPNNPIFSIPDLSPNGTTTVDIAFSIRANCAFVDTLDANDQLLVRDTWTFDYDLNGSALSETDITAEYRDAFAIPFFTIDVTNDNPPARVGECFTREVKVNNSSLDGVVDFLTYENIQGPGVSLTGLTVNGLSIVFDKMPDGLGDTLIVGELDGVLFSANQNGNGDGLFDPNEALTIVETYCFVSCDDFTGSQHRVWWGCDGATCRVSETIDFVTPGSGSANVGFTNGGSLPNEFAGYCTAGQTTITFSNGGVEFDEGFATMIDIEAGISLGALFETEAGGFILTGMRIGGVDLSNFQAMNLLDGNPQFATDPDGIGGLSDFDGDGFFDDLELDESFEITAFYEFDCSQAYAIDFDGECTNDFSTGFNARVEYTDACDVRQNRLELSYFRPSNTNSSLENSSDADAFAETDIFIVTHTESRTVRFFEHECNGAETFTIKVTIPENINLLLDQTTFLKNSIFDIPLLSNSMDNDTLILIFDATFSPFLNGNYDLNLAFQADCDAVLGPTEFPMTLEFNCPSCDCHHIWYCGILPGPQLHASVPPCSPDQLPNCDEGLRTTAFSANRTSLGYTDASYTQKVNPEDANLKVAISCDEIEMTVENVVGGTAINNNLGIVIQHFNPNESNSPEPLFHYVDGIVRFVIGGVPVECPVLASEVSLEADTSFKKYTINLSNCLQNLGLTLNPNDSVIFKGNFSLNPDGPFSVQFRQIPEFRGYGFALINGEEKSCDNFGENFTVAKNQIAFDFPNNSDFPNGCQETILEYRLITVNNGFNDFFLNEYRQASKVDSIVLYFDPAVITAFDDLSVDVSLPGHPDFGNDFYALPPLSDFPDGRYVASFDTLFQVPSLNEVQTYTFNLRLHLLPTCRSDVSSLVGDNLYDFDAKIHYFDRFYAAEIGDGSCQEFIIDSVNSVVAYEEPPFFNLTPVTNSNFILLGDTATWVVQHCNTSFESDAGLTWLAIEDPTATIQVVSMEDISDPDNPVLLTTQNYGTTGNNTFAYTDPLLRSNGLNGLEEICNFIRIKAVVTQCENVNFTARTGWNCDAYNEVDWNPELYPPCDDVLLGLALTFEDPFLDANVTDQPNTNPSICTTSSITILLKNIDRGTAFDVQTQFILPLAGATLLPNSVEIAYPSSADFQPALADPTFVATTLQGQVYQYDDFSFLNTFLDDNGLPGFNVISPSDSNELKIRYTYQTDCDFLSGGLSFYNFQGVKGCGDPSNFEAGESFPLIINGAEPDLSKLFQVSFSQNSVLVPNDLSTLEINVTNLTTTPTDENDFIKLSLPAGYFYDSNSTIAIQPQGWILGEPDISTQGGFQVLSWPMEENLLQNVTASFRFQVETPDLDCNADSPEVQLMTVSKTELFCENLADACEVETITSTTGAELTPLPIGSGLGVTFLEVSSVCANVNEEDLTISGIILSTGQEFLNEQFSLELYNDLDQNGVVEQNEPLLTTFLVSGEVTQANPLPFEFETTITSGDICNLIFRIQTQNAVICGELFALLPTPQIQNAGDTQIFCASENQVLSTIVGEPACDNQTLLDLTWSAILPAMDADISNNKLAQPTITFTHDGIGNDTLYYVLETARANCGESSFDTVQIILAEAVVVEDPTSVTIAPGESTLLEPNLLSGTSPFNFQWSPADGLDFTNIQNPTATPDETIEYTLITSNEFGCADTTIFPVEVVIPVDGEVTPMDTSICAEATVMFQASGGQVYNWIPSPDNPTNSNLDFANGSANPIFSGGEPGGFYEYEVIISLLQFPQFTDTVLVSLSIFDQPTVNAGMDSLICLGEQIQLTALPSGGTPDYEYSWSPQPLFGQNTATPIVQPGVTTEYTVTITDANGCTAQDMVTVLVENCGCTPATVSGTNTTPGTCAGGLGSASIQIDGNEAGYSYAWMPDLGIANSIGNARSNLPVGGYQVTIFNTDDPACFVETFLVIETSDGPEATVTTTPAACNAVVGTATLTPPDFNYQWSDGPTDNFRNDLSAGTYFVTFTDPNNEDCENVISVFIDDENSLVAELEILNEPFCGASNGMVEINVTGGSGNYDFDWPGGMNTQNGLAAGIYNVLITDLGPSGCTLPFIFVLNNDIPPATIEILDTLDVTCFGLSNGAVNFNIDLDPLITPPTQTIISNGLNEFQNGNLPTGQHCLVVTDGNGCIAGGACFEIESPDPIVVNSTSSEACNNTGGAIDIVVSGGSLPYTYLWENLPSGNDPTFANQSNLPPGFYHLTVTDNNNCLTVLDSLEVPLCLDCDVYPLADTAYFQISCDGLADVCLDISNDNLSNYIFTDNNQVYTQTLEHCDFTFIGVYSLTTLFGQGNSGPYELISWPGSSYTADSIFNSPQELVDIMNALDPDANWVLNFPFITGGVDGTNYGQMEALVTNLNLTSFIGFNPQFTPSAFALQLPVGTHEIIANDTIFGCSDTIFVEVICTNTDTLNIEIPVGDTLTFCFDNLELIGAIDTLFNACPEEIFVEINIASDTTCVDIIGIEVGEETACFVYCDSLGICDTTLINIEVIQPCFADTIVVGQVSEFCIPIGGLDLQGPITSLNIACPVSIPPIVDFTPADTSFCLRYEGIALGTGSTCVEVCDEFGNCDLVDFCITVLPGEIVTDTILIFSDTITYCLNTDSLEGNIVSITDLCEEENGASVIFSWDDDTFCVTYSGISEGIDTACILLVDDLDNQYLTTFIITALAITAEDYCDTIYINDPMVFYPDTTELPGTVIEGYNDCEDAATGNIDFYLNPLDYSVEYRGLALGKDTACMILCDDLGFCDTTHFCLFVADTLAQPIANDDLADTTQTGTPIVIDIKGNDILIGGIPEVTIISPL